MKKTSFIFLLSIVSTIFFQSCNKKEESSAPTTFWDYKGSTQMTARAISDFQKKYPTDEFLKLVNGQPLWEKGTQAIKINNQEIDPTLIVPVKVLNANEIRTLLLVSYKTGTLSYQIISPKDQKNLFFDWNKSHTKGYIKYLNEKIFNTKNSSLSKGAKVASGENCSCETGDNCECGCTRECYEKDNGQEDCYCNCWVVCS